MNVGSLAATSFAAGSLGRASVANPATAVTVTVTPTVEEEGGPALALGVSRFENTHADFTFTGVWENFADASSSGGTEHLSEEPGATVTKAFTVPAGTTATVEWIARRATWSSPAAEILLDGVEVATVDARHATSVVHQQTLWTGVIGPGSHTLGFRLPAGSTAGTWIYLDALSFSVAAVFDLPLGETRLENGHADFVYIGNWDVAGVDAASSGGTESWTGDLGASVTFSFEVPTGRTAVLEWIGTKTEWSTPAAEIVIDNAAPVYADTTAPPGSGTGIHQQVFWTSPPLAAGVHTIMFRLPETTADDWLYLDVLAFNVT